MKNARIERILNFRARSLEEARRDLISAEQVLSNARYALVATQRAWMATASLGTGQTINDLAMNREPLIELEASMRRSIEACALAEQSVGERRGQVMAAQFELRKIERWSERVSAREVQEESRVERRATDEHNARARASGE